MFMLLFIKVSVGQITFPSIIGEGMVLQQQFKVPLWGESKPDKKITIITSWDKKIYYTISDTKGLFKVYVNTPVAGGPYSISFNDGKEVMLSDVYIGEVWLCSGQSNMELPVKGSEKDSILNSKKELLNSNNKNIRLFRVDRYSSPTARSHSKGKWLQADAKSVASFSAVGYFYAKILEQELKVPIGIVETAWSGSRIEGWMSEESLRSFAKVKLVPKEEMKASNKKEFRDNPSGLFNGMVSPVVGYGIKGVLWYQGEANRKDPVSYLSFLPAMVKGWREQWQQGDWPFYYVQIAPYAYPKDKKPILIPFMRDIQIKALDKIPNSGIAISIDAGSEHTIHPPNKQIIARRLANWALANNYGRKDISFKSPLYESKKIINDKILLQFKYAEKGLTSYGKIVTDFEIAGEDKKFYPATATITEKGIEVYSEKVKRPAAVRYAFKAWVQGCIYNVEGLPVPSFRTDNWDI